MSFKEKVRNYGRMFYKHSGYVNPMKRGRLSSTRVTKNLTKLAKDINMVKSMVNAEKKRIVMSNKDLAIGQIANATGSGHYLLDITPNPVQGTGYQNKTGSSIKWHSSHFDLQFSGQGNCVSGARIKIYIVQVKGLAYATISDVMGKFINTNAFIKDGANPAVVYDINSARDPDYFATFKVLQTKTIVVPPDVFTGDVPVRQVSFGFKLKDHHVRCNDDTSTLASGQVFMLAVADRGNIGGTNSTLTGVPITQSGTGITFAYQMTHYFYDN